METSKIKLQKTKTNTLEVSDTKKLYFKCILKIVQNCRICGYEFIEGARKHNGSLSKTDLIL